LTSPLGIRVFSTVSALAMIYVVGYVSNKIISDRSTLRLVDITRATRLTNKYTPPKGGWTHGIKVSSQTLDQLSCHGYTPEFVKKYGIEWSNITMSYQC
jgi:hypothetical protein